MNLRSPTFIITGFMGAGKTTVAHALAQRLGDTALDLDAHVAALSGLTPRELIDAKGEQVFRDVETYALRAALTKERVRVVALGGGTWTLQRNRALVESHGGVTVWLDAPFELCWERIRRERDDRPLARDEQQARLLYDARRSAYALARHRVAVAPDADAGELAAVILELSAEG